MTSTSFGNLLGPEPTLLPARPDAQAALDAGTDPTKVAATFPDFSGAWAALADDALAAGEPVAAYAYARTGYHRGLDQLRRAGWKGHGPVPWSHQPNQGFLRALAALAKAEQAIGDSAEYQRCGQFLADSDPAAPAALGL
jgi:hypothetical protein